MVETRTNAANQMRKEHVTGLRLLLPLNINLDLRLQRTEIDFDGSIKGGLLKGYLVTHMLDGEAEIWGQEHDHDQTTEGRR